MNTSLSLIYRENIYPVGKTQNTATPHYLGREEEDGAGGGVAWRSGRREEEYLRKVATL